MTPGPSRTALLDALAWQVELGATDAVGDAPVDRTALPERAPWLPSPAASAPAAGRGGGRSQIGRAHV